MSRAMTLGMFAAGLAACSNENEKVMVGQLESVHTQISGPVAENLQILWVEEGQRVNAGDPLFQLDSRQAEASVRQAEAALAAADARLAEVLRGPRAQVIDAAEASLNEAREELALRALEKGRAQDLLDRQLGARETLDFAQAAYAMTQDRVAGAAARFNELTAGSTAEERAVAIAFREQAAAELAQWQVALSQLTAISPISATVDQVLLEVGERALAGQPVLSLLQTNATYARIYVPAALRLGAAPGDAVLIDLPGRPSPVRGTLRWVSREAAFTPYFALTRHDRDRLTYAAEVTLPAGDANLPSGVPVQARFVER